MNDKERAECLIALHNTQMDHFRQTRDLEFKVNLALWAVIVFAAQFLHGKISLDSPLAWLSFCLFGVLVVGAHLFLWMMPIQNSEDTDDHFICAYRREIEKLAAVTLPRPGEKLPVQLWKLQDRLRKHGWSWIIFEVGITFLLYLGSGLVLSLT